MKVLLDENIDIRFKKYFSDPAFKVFTIRDMGWNGYKNGLLLELIKENGFDCWIVVDKNIKFQQNTLRLPCKILVLDVFRNSLKKLIPLLPQIFTALKRDSKNEIILINEKSSNCL